jgi:hypothetical protein
MAKGKATEACPRFEESQRLDSGLGTQYHLADCYEAVGKLASAHTLFLEVAAQAHVLGQKRREQVARERAEAVEPRLAKLTIEVPDSQAPGLLVERDGIPVGRAQWGLPVPVDAGLHRVQASAPGSVPWAAEVEVPDGAAVHMVNVPPLATLEGSSFFEPTSRKAGLVALGVGVATLGLGTVFAIQASSKNDESNRAGCNGGVCPTPASHELRNQARAAGNRATWAAGLGAVSLGAAAALFWIIPELGEDEEGDAPSGFGEGLMIEPVASSSGASVRLQGRF